MLTEATERVKHYYIELVERLALSEKLAYNIYLSIKEQLGLKENVARIQTLKIAIAEQLELTEETAKKLLLGIAEKLGLTETIAIKQQLGLALKEKIGLVESLFGDWWQGIIKKAASWTNKTLYDEKRLLNEDDGFLLQENGYKILLDEITTWIGTTLNISTWTDKDKTKPKTKL